MEIIVVVDGSTDGTAARLRTLPPHHNLRIVGQENRGLAGARNRGLRAAEGEIVVFLDDDMWCAPGWVSAHAAALQQTDRTIGIGAFFVSPDSPRSLARDCSELELGAFHRQYKPGQPVPLSACTFGNTSAPRKALLEIGGFDQRLRMREDAELALRLRKGGFQFHYVPDAVAYHFFDKSATDLVRDAARFGEADALVLRSHPEYCEFSELGRLALQPWWKRSVRRLIAKIPVLPDAALRACWSAAERFGRGAPRIWRFGVRALQLHRGLVWYRRVCNAWGPDPKRQVIPRSRIDSLLEQVEAVEGWLAPAEAEFLIRAAARCSGRGAIVEIGSWKGKSTVALASGSMLGKGVGVWSVDPHEPTRLTPGMPASSLQELQRNLEHAGVAEIVVPLVTTSQQAARNWNQPVELIFIDGDHSYASVRNDLDSWERFLVPGSIVAFHDCMHDGICEFLCDVLLCSPRYRRARLCGSILAVERAPAIGFIDRAQSRYIRLLLRGYRVFSRRHLPPAMRKLCRRIFDQLAAVS